MRQVAQSTANCMGYLHQLRTMAMDGDRVALARSASAERHLPTGSAPSDRSDDLQSSPVKRQQMGQIGPRPCSGYAPSYAVYSRISDEAGYLTTKSGGWRALLRTTRGIHNRYRQWIQTPSC